MAGTQFLIRCFILVFLTSTQPAFLSISLGADKPSHLTINTSQKSGDAEGIGGGDTVDSHLRAALLDLNQALFSISKLEHTEQLCEKVSCPIGVAPNLCSNLNQLKPSQKTDCQSFAKSLALQIFNRKQPVSFVLQS